MISDEELGKGLLTLKIYWIALLWSLAIYVFVGLQARINLRAPLSNDTFAMLRMVLYVVAFATIIITPYIKKSILSAKVDPLKTSQKFQHPILQKYATAMIVAWAMSESIGIYGLVLFFLGKNPTDLYLLILISTSAMVMYRPKKEEIISLSQENWESSPTSGAAV